MRQLFGSSCVAAVVAAAMSACSGTDSQATNTSPALPDGGGAQSATTGDAGKLEAEAGPEGTASVPGVPSADVCRSSAKQLCTFLTTCSPNAVEAMWAAPEDCLRRYEDNCNASLPAGASLRKDDADELEACLDGLQCEALYGPRWPTACPFPRLLTAKPVAAPCRIDSECESRSCSGSSITCGACMARLPAGSPCTSSAQCARAGFCDKVCTEVAFLGDACDARRVCGNGLTCTNGTCVKVGGPGAACKNGASCDLAASQGCNTKTSTCEALTFAEPGEACPSTPSGTPVLCMKGSRCVTPDLDQPGTCVAPAKVGEDCSSAQPCETGINCRDGKCVLPTYVACP